VNEQIASEQVKANVAILAARRERWYQGIAFVPLADGDIFGYVLVGLNGEEYPRDLNTDSIVMYLKNHQMPDGRWATAEVRGLRCAERDQSDCPRQCARFNCIRRMWTKPAMKNRFSGRQRGSRKPNLKPTKTEYGGFSALHGSIRTKTPFKRRCAN